MEYAPTDVHLSLQEKNLDLVEKEPQVTFVKSLFQVEEWHACKFRPSQIAIQSGVFSRFVFMGQDTCAVSQDRDLQLASMRISLMR